MAFKVCAGDHHDLMEVVPDLWRCRACALEVAKTPLRTLADLKPYKAPNHLSLEVKKYKNLQKALSELLSPEQLEAAEIAGMSPELYCLEWLKSILVESCQDNLQEA